MSKFRVGIDLDGCNVMFEDGVNAFNKQEGRDLVVDTTNYNFFEAWGWTLPEYLDFCARGVAAKVIFNNPPLPGAVEAWHRIKDMGHDIIVITNRFYGGTASHDLTREWLARYGFPYDELHFSADKTIVPTDVFVEDNLSNYDALEAAGTDAFLIERPWNKMDDNRLRITDMSEFADVVGIITNFASMV